MTFEVKKSAQAAARPTSDQLRELEGLGDQIIKLRDAGQFASAIQLAKTANDRARSYLGPEHPMYVGGLDSLAHIYYLAGDYNEALRTLGDKLLAVYQIRGLEGQIASTLGAIAQVRQAAHRSELGATIKRAEKLWDEGERHLAEKQYQKILTSRDYHWSSKFLFFQSLVKKRLASGLHDEALAAAVDSADLMRGYLPESWQELALSLNLVGTACQALKRYEEARAAFTEAVQLEKSNGGDYNLAASLFNLGNLLEVSGSLAESNSCFEQALLCALQSKEEMTEVSYIIQHLVAVNARMGQLEKLLSFARKNVPRSENAFQALLSESIRGSGRYQERRLIGQIWRELVEVTPEEQLDRLFASDNALLVADSEEDGHAAARLFGKVIAAREREQGPDSPFLGFALDAYAGFLDDKGDYVTAEPMFRRALDIFKRSGSKKGRRYLPTQHGHALRAHWELRAGGGAISRVARCLPKVRGT